MATEAHRIVEAEDVTDEVLELAWSIATEMYDEIDWLDFWERLGRRSLEDGRQIDLTETSDTPAQQKIQETIRKWRSYG